MCDYTYMKQVQDNIAEKNTLELNLEELSYARTPIGKTILAERIENPPKPEVVEPRAIKRHEKVKCEVCGKIVSRNHLSTHRKTEYHQKFKTVLDNVCQLVLNTHGITRDVVYPVKCKNKRKGIKGIPVKTEKELNKE